MKKCIVFFFFVLSLAATPLLAEPYFAVREGLDCASCHVNPRGGGLRNIYGKVYGQTQLPAYTLEETQQPVWTGELLERFLVGGNARYNAREFDNDDRDDNIDFGVDRVSFYLSGSLNRVVSFLVDQQVSPGASRNRESWVKLSWNEWYLKAGKIFLPFGWRLEDDSAFTRELTGINFNNPDNEVELGLVQDNWSLQLSISNGTAGSTEVDDGKQLGTRFVRISENWQLGCSANINHTDIGDWEMYGFFAGLNTGPVTWLVEWDHIDDSGFTSGSGEQDVALVEANWSIAKGHNLKITVEQQQFNDNRGDPERMSPPQSRCWIAGFGALLC